MKSLFREHRLTWIAAVLFAAIGVIYSLVTPVFEASDELSHYPVVQHIATHWELPVQRPGVETLWEQEGSQPPLFYLISAVMTSWIDTSDLPQFRDRNPHAKLGIPLDSDNKNMILHTEAELFPWKGTVLAVHLLRLFGVALGTVSVLLAYQLAAEMWPDAPHIPLLTACLVAFNPMFLFISASVNNDNLIIALAMATLLLVARILRHGLTLRRSINLAVIVGLASLTKISGLTLLPVAGLALAISGWRTRQWRSMFIAAGVLALAVAVIAGWWYVRNLRLYGELLGINMQVLIAGGRTISLWDLLRTETHGFWVSYWALFGSVNILADPAVYWLYGAISAVGVIGAIYWGVQTIRARAWDDLIIPGVLLCQAAVTLIGLIRWTLTTYASQGRLMFPVIGVLSAFTAWGLMALIPSRARMGATLALSGVLLAIAMIAPFRYIAPIYAPPPSVAEIPAYAIPVGAHWDGLELVAVETPLATVTDNDWIPITLYWRATGDISTNYSLFLHALGRNNQEIGKIDSYPGNGTLPTSRYTPGVIIKDSYRVPTLKNVDVPKPEDFDAPTRIRMLIGMGIFSPDNADSYVVIPATKADGTSFGNIVIDAGVAYPQDRRRCAASHPASARSLGTLGGFARAWADTPDQTVRPGDQIAVSLYWDRLDATPKDWTVFVHLVGEDGKNLANADSPPLNNDFPTSLWRLPCEVNDIHVLHVPTDAPPGQYRILVGLYDASDPAFARAAAIADDGSPYPDNAIPISSIQVEKP